MEHIDDLGQMLVRLDDIVARCAVAESQARMCELVLANAMANSLVHMPPFSEAYVQRCREVHTAITGIAAYEPSTNELVKSFDAESALIAPSPYNFGDSASVGDFFLAWGAILRHLNVSRGQSVVEYGAGEGQLAIALARLGCEVTVVDLEQRYLDSIQAQCERLGVHVTTHRGLFGDPVGGRKFDRVVFFEAFHHAFDHRALAVSLLDRITDDGFLLFAGEPVVPSGDSFVPFPWGPRLDGLSVYSMNKFGWMELGFQEDYFVEFLMRAGWLVTAEKHPMTFRGNCYIARPNRGTIELGSKTLIAMHGVDCGWDAPEGAFRWTHGHARVPVADRLRHAQSVSVEVGNYLPGDRDVSIRSGGNTATARLPSGAETVLRIAVDPEAAEIEIVSGADRVCDLIPGNVDERLLGAAVKTIRFDPVP